MQSMAISMGTWILLGSGLLMMLLGVAVKHWKWYWLIAGFNTMPKEQKKQVNTEGLGRAIGNFLFLLGALMMGGSLLEARGMDNAFLVTMLAQLMVIPIFVVWVQRYDPSTRNADGRMKLSVKAVLGVVILACGFSALLIGYGLIPPDVTVTGDAVSVSGMYGTTFQAHRISEVQLVETIPGIRRKTSGMNAGSVRKGWFELESGENALLFVTLNRPPYVTFRDEHRLVIINQKDSQSTASLYQAISDLADHP